MNDLIKKYDSTNMYRVLTDFPEQVRVGISIGKAADVSAIDPAIVQNIVITGMGGSAIGGDILRSFAASHCRTPININRHYALPAFVNDKSLVVTASYSGETEETLSAMRQALEAGAQVLALTSGGTLGKIAREKNLTLISIPGGLAPRCALGYSFFPLLMAMIRLGFISLRDTEVEELSDFILEKTKQHADFSSQNNLAIQIATKLQGKIPIIYSATEMLDVVNLRWRNQIEENAKVLAFGNTLPEMNHNEIVGWEQMPESLKKFIVIALRQKSDHSRVARRFDVTLDLLREYPSDVIEIWAQASSPLTRILELICLGDWVSFYAAMFSGVDPFPIVKINKLKKALEEFSQ